MESINNMTGILPYCVTGMVGAMLGALSLHTIIKITLILTLGWLVATAMFNNFHGKKPCLVLDNDAASSGDEDDDDYMEVEEPVSVKSKPTPKPKPGTVMSNKISSRSGSDTESSAKH